MSTIDLSGLRRWPDFEAENLYAEDATDRLLIRSASEQIKRHRDQVVVIGDHYGALTLGALRVGAGRVRVWQDTETGRRALGANANRISVDRDGYTFAPLGAELMRGAQVVLMQLPKDLPSLGMIAHLVAAVADPTVTVFAGGRVKHMTPRMNHVLEDYFQDVHSTRSEQKSRLIIARSPRHDLPAWELPFQCTRDQELDLSLYSLPGVFSPGRIDIGTRFLATHLAALPPAQTVVDLGSGSGVLGALWLRSHPDSHLIATDTSEIATLCTRATLQENVPEADFSVVLDHGLSSQPDNSVDLVLCNPPFHVGAGVIEALSTKLFAEVGRVLRPGGKMVTVFNSHLPHRQSLAKLVGPTEQIARNSKFTVTISTNSLTR